ncbi:MAG: alpha/beta hydrolase [Bacilli bacterium]
MGNRAGSNPVIPTKMEILIPIIFTLFSLIVVIFLAIFFLLFAAFNRRFDQHPNLKYFTIKDFPAYDYDEVEFQNEQGVILRGGFYYDDRQQPHRQLLVFAHGIGAGHHAYTHLIMEFVKKGYLVFAYDNMGSGLSDGKSIRGVPQAILDLKSALRYLKQTTYATLPITLMGHSWGGYAVIRGAKMDPSIKRIVSLTPFNDVTEMLATYLPWIRNVKPFVRLATFLRFGLLATSSTSQILRHTSIPTLVISGEKDDEIPLKGNYELFQRIPKANLLVRVDLAIGHRHNPYLSFQAEAYVIDTILQGTVSMAKEKDQKVRDQFFQSLDYRLVGEHDSKIIERIDSFLKN